MTKRPANTRYGILQEERALQRWRQEAIRRAPIPFKGKVGDPDEAREVYEESVQDEIEWDGIDPKT